MNYDMYLTPLDINIFSSSPQILLTDNLIHNPPPVVNQSIDHDLVIARDIISEKYGTAKPLQLQIQEHDNSSSPNNKPSSKEVIIIQGKTDPTNIPNPLYLRFSINNSLTSSVISFV